jgi:hypothetical protein
MYWTPKVPHASLDKHQLISITALFGHGVITDLLKSKIYTSPVYCDSTKPLTYLLLVSVG